MTMEAEYPPPQEILGDDFIRPGDSARQINQTRDPPGQRSIYVRPGDSARETYRLSTFKDFPSHIPVDVRRLASHGFYFTGYKDRVKCFSCGQCIQDWSRGDDPTLPEWHRRDCELVNGNDERNIPLLPQFSRNMFATNNNRRLNQQLSSTNHLNQQQPIRAGQALTNGLTTTQSSVDASPVNTSIYQTARVSQASSTAPSSATTRQNGVSNNMQTTPRQNGAETSGTSAYAAIFPCENPVNAHMRSEESRLQTFLDHARSWPAPRIRATPRDIARAGMYYLGDSARQINQTRDPPGQRSIYVRPGDIERETYRLSTFKDFPSHIPVDVRRLASHGFYFTGYKDRVKCFSCGQCIEDWSRGDDPTLPGWHRPDCELVNGNDERNIPLLPQFSRNMFATNNNRRLNEQSSSTNHSNQQQSIRAGQALTNGLTTSVNTSPVNTSIYQTARVSQASSTAPSSTTTRQNGVSNNMQTTPRQNGAETSGTSAYAAIFPCENPVNAHMRSEESRLQTFLDHATSWPAHRIRATPRDIARAGMYYLGERDRVKCWYCNGGLQNWERFDEPWEEHAKWYPMCEFVLRQKGPDFVHRLVARFPDIRRPILRNPASALPPRFGGMRLSYNRPQRITTNESPVIVDPKEEARVRNRKIEEEMNSSEQVAQAKLMRFEEQYIRTALRRQYEIHNRGFSTFESLVESILSLENVPTNGHTQTAASASNQSNPNIEINRSMSVSTISTTLGINEIRRLEEERVCKICHNQPSSVVLLPCGHIASCVDCNENITTCPICQTTVNEKLRSYIV